MSPKMIIKQNVEISTIIASIKTLEKAILGIGKEEVRQFKSAQQLHDETCKVVENSMLYGFCYFLKYRIQFTIFYMLTNIWLTFVAHFFKKKNTPFFQACFRL
jgi:hypothetical protein